ncbi:mRNA interferase HigB [Dyadobacter sp. BE34]|uniref:mRNA interferase HigB n=1 Tax=Dyadobacter fermentans TaxID=94254 RepID=A0ABU1R208_9BACT|nr:MULTISPECIES: type II toxin-antitoxin system HigB family toxin [Dyadobacter]MDR6807434.1 mRNA interferase HigB [Dyadobacter fermentans]MDR7045175.1 mRNA interferase HigB [Dyadobacter sp. BE242]MDR7199088.1 mRNA interferase HigB [Dyadobacter sp. BE34]MDR7217048.1 mRNA interferase HigB [Dyadobacter sp. BE31]MDR7264981.1 mRNA interferase HigB [Dyadobacter sp. BE32]
MKRIFAKGTLREFWERHPEVEQYLKTWYEDVLAATWKSPAEVKSQYAKASILKNGRIVFNIRGNSFRLVAHFDFERQMVYIRFIGSHKEYDKIDANSI